MVLKKSVLCFCALLVKVYYRGLLGSLFLSLVVVFLLSQLLPQIIRTVHICIHQCQDCVVNYPLSPRIQLWIGGVHLPGPSLATANASSIHGQVTRCAQFNSIQVACRRLEHTFFLMSSVKHSLLLSPHIQVGICYLKGVIAPIPSLIDILLSATLFVHGSRRSGSDTAYCLHLKSWHELWHTILGKT